MVPAMQTVVRLLLACIVLCWPILAAGDSIVYQCIGDAHGGRVTNNLNSPGQQLGDEVLLAGTARTVTQMRVAVRSQVDNVSVRLTLRLFAQDGPNGAPGTMLYQSETLSFVANKQWQWATFLIPRIGVPNRFTWTMQFDGGTPWTIGMPFSDLVVGSSPNYAWVCSAKGVWHKDPPVGSFGETRNDFMAEVTASDGPPLAPPATPASDLRGSPFPLDDHPFDDR